ncbi:uncharacterized protein J4E88_000216 [Alternaria novae-zelandiae]|uniref:uncharacterized protein n=2 Tax=Alternaria sect. Infectoriae TaxID=2499258 RepID=UPI0020C562C5|nr:uncharacterized protein J4E88_000216 [Alternaria novae-zelandiae]KAI4696044.1 hypothetical protein J4E88_000216 [Alternaria novae-zelandiae]
MDILASFVLVTSVLARQVVAVTTQQIETDLSSNLSNRSHVILTTDSSYPTELTQRWSIYDKAEPTYAVAAKPATARDVQTILRYATKNKVPLLATGGGHGYSTTLSGLHNALDVDLRNFKKIKVDASTNTMVVGAGSTFHDMFDPLYAAGKMMPSGGTSPPSIIGLTLGGGVGPLTGEHGLLIDSLLSVEMVTGSGEILTASATENSDLFWGMRGAGFNFGVVTSATYRIYDTINDGMVYNADMSFEAEKNATIFEIFQTYQGKQDDKLALTIGSSIKNNVPTIDVSAIYYGNKQQGDAAIKSFINQKPYYSNISVVPYNRLVSVANFCGDIFAQRKGVGADMWGFQLNNLTVPALVDTFTKYMNFLRANPAIENTNWIIEKFGLGVTASIDDDSTAYAWRKTVAYGFFAFYLPGNVTAEQTSAVDTFTAKIRTELMSACGNPDGNVFPNYARGDEKPEQVYGATKLPRLRLLKKRYDPKGLFNHFNSFA